MREVYLKDVVPGRLFLSEMPGLYFPLDKYEKEFADKRINLVLCLAPLQEIKQKSPQYALKLEKGLFPFPVEFFPIEDYGIPKSIGELVRVAKDAAMRLKRGEHILIHCGAGIGRTGMVAICVLQALGLPLEEASVRVQRAGSGPETTTQQALVELFSSLQGSAKSW